MLSLATPLSSGALWYSIPRMVRFLRLPIGLAATALLCLPLAAQPAGPFSPILHRGKRVAPNTRPTPFPMGREAPPVSSEVEFQSPDRMSDADRTLVANFQADISRRAAVDAFEVNQGTWTRQQILCRALPNHLFLRYTRDDGARDRSVFSVSIPRDGKGRVRVIPVLRRGYSLFTPVGANAGTIAAFNQIRREDGPSSAGWLETGLCYAALAGANPRVGPLTGDTTFSEPTPPLAEMLVPVNGGAVVTFTDQTSRPRPSLWSLTFQPDGTLVKVEHQPAIASPHLVTPATGEIHGKSIPATSVEPDGNQPVAADTQAPPEQSASH